MDTRLLIVDDDTAIRDAMCKYLELVGYRTYGVASAEDSLELLKENKIHVVITDIMMSGMNGLELTDFIKREYDIDVIVMTGYSGDFSYEEAISKGASDFVFKPIRFEELHLRLKRVLRERQLKKERDQMLDRLQKLAITDGLTQLYNSRHFYNRLEMEISRSIRYGNDLALLLLDIDLFKNYNDAYGHLEGDKVLIKIGKIIQTCLRQMDSAYRYGGEEFTIILPETKAEDAFTVAHRIRKTIENHQFIPDGTSPVSITISIGITEYCPKEDAAAFIQRSDKAMYMSKQKGRNSISCLLAQNSSYNF
ncbi:MAG: diguanylate cyclase [Desulfobacterales bacterium]